MKFQYRHINRLIFPAAILGTFMGSLLAFNPAYVDYSSAFFTTSSTLDSTEKDTGDIQLKYPFEDKGSTGFDDDGSPLHFEDPSNIKKGFEYDPETGQYNYFERLGEDNYRSPNYMDIEEYLEYDLEKSQKDFWRQKANAQTLNKSQGFRPKLNVKGELFDRIFGGNTIDIRPQGSAELSFGIKYF